MQENQEEVEIGRSFDTKVQIVVPGPTVYLHMVLPKVISVCLKPLVPLRDLSYNFLVSDSLHLVSLCHQRLPPPVDTSSFTPDTPHSPTPVL